MVYVLVVLFVFVYFFTLLLQIVSVLGAFEVIVFRSIHHHDLLDLRVLEAVWLLKAIALASWYELVD